MESNKRIRVQITEQELVCLYFIYNKCLYNFCMIFSYVKINVGFMVHHNGMDYALNVGDNLNHIRSIKLIIIRTG